jgi:hypothetical protein
MRTDEVWCRLLAVTGCGKTNARPQVCAPPGPAAHQDKTPHVYAAGIARRGEQAGRQVRPGEVEMTAGKDGFARRAVRASGSLPGQVLPEVAGAGARPRPRDEAVVALYHGHYLALVRTAVLLVGDVATAEDVVQDSFTATYRAWWRLRDTSRALPYLRRAVMNRARSVLRQRAAADRHAGGPAPDVASAEEDALANAGTIIGAGGP